MRPTIIATPAAIAPYVADDTFESCVKLEKVFTHAAPALLLVGLLVEACLFASALSTAKAAARLILAARAYGANGI